MSSAQDELTAYTLDRDMSFRQLAAALTIGGAAYGPALAQVNGYTDENAVMPAGSTIQLPWNWVGDPAKPAARPVVTYYPAPTSTGTPQLLGVPWYVWAAVVGIVLASA